MTPNHNALDRQTLTRWRLVLGKSAETHGLGLAPGDEQSRRIEQLLGYLFGEGSAPSQPARGQASLAPGHPMTIPRWVDEVNELFPRQAREVMERELVARRGLKAILEKPEVLERIEPSTELVKTLLTHKGLLNEKTRVLARKIIDQVVQELKNKLRLQVLRTITGAIRRDQHSPRKVFRNLDLKRTIRRNLHHFDRKTQKLLVSRIYYHAAESRHQPWQVIIAVDQSGSMLESAIFSAVMASIFHALPAVRTSLFAFDTEVADLTERLNEPVDVLMTMQLGGGTDITRALQYAEQLVRQPLRTIVVLVTDFHEGRPEAMLIQQVKRMAQAGIRMIGLAALGYDARPAYNKSTAGKCRKAGMDILSCTPESLAEAMARIIRG